MSSMVDEKNGGGGKILKSLNGDKADEWLPWKSKFKALMVAAGLIEGLMPIEEAEAWRTPMKETSSTGKATKEKKGGAKEEAKTSSTPSSMITINMRIYSKLVLFTEGAANDVVVQYDDTMDGQAAWQALIDKFELKGDVRKSVLQNNLVTNTMGEGEDLDKYFMRLEQASAS